MSRLVAIAALALAAALAVVGSTTHPASCPTEDACRPVYEDGTWSVVEVTP